MTYALTITPGELTLAQLRQVQQHAVTITLDPAALPAIEASAATVAKIVAENRTVYGINTGFGLLANTKINKDQLELLQRSIVLSHAAGFGDLMDDSTVRLMMVLKINSLARGFSGIRLRWSHHRARIGNHSCHNRWWRAGRRGRPSAIADRKPRDLRASARRHRTSREKPRSVSRQ